MVATLAKGGGAGSVGPVPALAGGGWVGRPAVWVWFLVLGRAGSPLRVYPQGRWVGLLCR
jgi:hypothetical protein